MNNTFLVSIEVLEKLFSVPVEERPAMLAKLLKEKKAEYLGYTPKSIPELATELIKKGVKAKSYVVPKVNKKAVK